MPNRRQEMLGVNIKENVNKVSKSMLTVGNNKILWTLKQDRIKNIQQH